GSPDGGAPAQEAPPPNDGNPEGDPNGQGPPKPPPRPKTLHERAMDAFRAGRDVEGFKLLHQYFAVMPTAGQELADKMAWIPALSRPAFGPRIGVAVEFNESTKTFAGKIMPIGSADITAAVDRMQAADAADSRIGGSQRVNKFGNRGIPGMASKNKLKMMMAAKGKGKGGGG